MPRTTATRHAVRSLIAITNGPPGSRLWSLYQLAPTPHEHGDEPGHGRADRTGRDPRLLIS
eukprot:250642-Prymnesium_polylepis.1